MRFSISLIIPGRLLWIISNCAILFWKWDGHCCTLQLKTLHFHVFHLLFLYYLSSSCTVSLPLNLRVAALQCWKLLLTQGLLLLSSSCLLQELGWLGLGTEGREDLRKCSFPILLPVWAAPGLWGKSAAGAHFSAGLGDCSSFAPRCSFAVIQLSVASCEQVEKEGERAGV